MRLVLIALLLSATPALANPLPIEKGQNINVARKLLMEEGWDLGPRPSSSPNRCAIGYEIDCTKGPMAEAIVTCRGTGLAGCLYAFWRDNDVILVDTTGEEIPRQLIKSIRWTTDDKKSDIFRRMGF